MTAPHARQSGVLALCFSVLALGGAPRKALALDPGKSLRQYSLDVWDTRDNLPHNTVAALQRTADGYLWVGTEAGLARFDGVRFQVYEPRTTPAFDSAQIRCFTVDPSGALWIGTNGGGLVKLDKGVFSRFSKDEGLTGYSISSIVQSKDSRLWLAMMGGGLTAVDKGVASDQTPLVGGKRSGLDTLGYDPRTDTVWAAADPALVAIRSTGRPETLRLKGAETWGRIQAILVSAKGDLVIGTEAGGVIRYDGKNVEQTTAANGLASNDVRALMEDQQGTLWVGTAAGLSRIVGTRIDSMVERDGLPHSTVIALHEDREGSLWIGTKGGGLARLKDGVFTSYSRTEGLANDSTNAVVETEDGSIWVGTEAGLTRILQGVVTNFTARDGLPSASILSLAPDRRGGLWVGTEAGFTHWNGSRFSSDPALEALSRSVSGRAWNHAILERDGWLWASVQHNLRRVRLTDNSVERFSRKDSDTMLATSLTVDPQGKIWVGTYNGLAEITGGSEPRIHEIYKTRARDSKGAIQALLADGDQTLWLATRDRGLARFRDGKVAVYDSAAGLPSDDLYSVLDDGLGNLWCGSSRGILRIALKSLEQFDSKAISELPCVTYGISDGLRSAESRFSGGPGAWRARDGRLWFCTRRGVSVADPRAVTSAQATPIGFQAIVKGKTQIADPTNARLGAGQEDVEIHYTGLNLLAPEKIRFKYRLSGQGEVWTEAGTRRIAYFTGLGPGEYVFSVLATRTDGTWDDKPAELRFSIGRLWYQTWPFRGFVGLLVLGVIVLAYRWRVAIHEARERELAQGIEVATQGLKVEQDLLHALMDNIPDLIYFKDAKSRYTRINSAHSAALGVAQTAEAYGRSDADFFPESFAAASRKDEIDLFESRKPILDRVEHDEANGKWYLATKVPLVGPDGAVSGLVGISKDITERKEAEERLAREQELLHALMDNIPDLIYFKDRESRYTRINAAHAAALGVKDPAEAYGRSDADFFPESFAAASRRDEAALLSSRKPILGKVEHEEASARWYLATKVPIVGTDGTVKGLVGISKDITERKEAEDKLARELAAFQELVTRVSEGNLTLRGVEGDDTLGRISRSVNGMLGSFSAILDEVRDAAFSVSSACSEILAASTQIAKSSRYGSDEVHQTSSAVEEMASSMSQVSRSAELSAETARQVLEHVKQSDQSVNATVVGMTKIDAAVSETAAKMRQLEERSQEVFEIIALIEEIASQSNLLSLNAAIEAAHAGDAGRGFAVVADEIRRLAERSTGATKNVTSIVQGIVKDTRAVLAAMENGMIEVKGGRELSEIAQKSLHEIQALVQRSVELATQISGASREQTEATQMVAQSMQTIANVTYESAAGATQTSKAVQDLVSLAEQLTGAISRFKIDEKDVR